MSLKKHINIKKTAILAIPALLLMPLLAMAIPLSNSSNPSVPTPTSTFTTTNIPDVNIDQILTNIGNYFFGFVIVACTFVILWAAFNMVTAGDDGTKVENSKKMLLWAFVGMALAASARAIVGVVQSIIGVH
jgi:hypothetical protein